MSDDSKPRSIGLVVEAPADARTARILVDRALRARATWIDDDSLLEHIRAWRGIEPDSPVTYWKHVRALARAHDVRSHGHFSGEPGAPDAQAARRALLLLTKLGMPDAVVLLRDADAQPERRTGLQQARDGSAHFDRIAVGVAEPEREAWLLAGFRPCNEDERAALARERQRLGFDPCVEPHGLRGEGKRSAKTALANLTGSNRDRERQCLADTPLEHLRRRGAGCGLLAFLDELGTRVASVIV
jgi:hypothetical protein